MTMSITIGWDIPRRRTSLYSDLCLARRSPAINAPSKTGQKPVSSDAPDSPSHPTPPRKTTNGNKAPAVPP